MKNFIKSFPVIILLSLVICCVNIPVFAEEPAFQLGDVNKDGQITAEDALLVLKHAAKISTVDASLADIDKSNTIEANDALWILKYAARLISDFSDATPIPVADNIKTVKNYLKTNGISEGSVYYVGYYVSDDDSMISYMVYYEEEDLLQMEFSYYEETEEGMATLVEIYMPITGANTDSLFYAGYAYGDYSEYVEASAPINISSTTYDTTFNYQKVASYNIDDADLPDLFKEASSLTSDSLSLWNYICNEEVGLGLKDLGFLKL